MNWGQRKSKGQSRNRSRTPPTDLAFSGQCMGRFVRPLVCFFGMEIGGLLLVPSILRFAAADALARDHGIRSRRDRSDHRGVGTQVIRARDTVTSTITGTQGGIVVS